MGCLSLSLSSVLVVLAALLEVEVNVLHQLEQQKCVWLSGSCVLIAQKRKDVLVLLNVAMKDVFVEQGR